MGECNFELAAPGQPVRLIAKPFAYGECLPPAVPVFQLRPGAVTLASLTEWPGEGFRLVAARGEIVQAPEHRNLQSPYSRIAFGRALGGFLEDYSRAGGTHHLALAFGDLTAELRSLAGLCRMGFRAV
jgi:L-arabinose isomerase